jgi:DNA-binding beta-propeller fold protein YncE
MKNLFSCVAIVALLEGCGGSQPPIGAPGAMPLSLQSSAVFTRIAARAVTDAKDTSYLYVANWGFGSGGGIYIFLRDDPSKGVVDKIRDGVSTPDGIFIDTHGNLYVTNGHMSGRESVEMYAKGGHKPIRIYTGALCAFDVIAADDGTVYITDACGGPHTRGRVLVYPPGKTKPSRSFFPGGTPYCLTLDAKNNLYVGYNSVGSYAGQVKRYRPGAKDGVNLLPPNTVHFLTSVAVDEHGALLVANEVGGAIDVFTGKDEPPSRVIKTGQSHPFMFAFNRRENTIYVTNPCVGSPRPLTSAYCPPSGLPNTVAAIDYASGKPLWTIKVKVGWVPAGVAVAPSAPF